MFKGKRVVRRVDELGRIRLPAEIINALNIKSGDYLEFFPKEDSITAQKYLPTCVFCGQFENVIKYNNTFVCKACIEKMTASEDS